MKNRFPFRLGTTSCVLQADLLANIHFLKDKVDHIEILLFETETTNNYPSKQLTSELITIAGDFGLSYSVHLPLDVKLANPDSIARQKDVEKTLRAIDATRPLNPCAWDLHLEQNYHRETPGQAWQDACTNALEQLHKGGAEPARIGIENLDFDYRPILPILDQTGFAVTLDLGHVWYNEFSEDFYLEQLLPRAVSVHLHGYDQQDHQSLHTIRPARLLRFLEASYALPCAKQLPVSIEVFSQVGFERSWQALEQARLSLSAGD